MFAKCLLATIGIVVLATPALSDQFYIVQDAATKRCAIAEQPPSESAASQLVMGLTGTGAARRLI
jgi:hypothetical protein